MSQKQKLYGTLSAGIVNHPATCPGCGRLHQITQRDFDLFGPDCWCIKCTDWKHVDFMHTIGRELNLTCVPGCRCGRGQQQSEDDYWKEDADRVNRMSETAKKGGTSI